VLIEHMGGENKGVAALLCAHTGCVVFEDDEKCDIQASMATVIINDPGVPSGSFEELQEVGVTLPGSEIIGSLELGNLAGRVVARMVLSR
jgi:hypothetical protein